MVIPLNIAAWLARHTVLTVVQLGTVLEEETQTCVLVESIKGTAGVGCAQALTRLLCSHVVLT